MSRTSAFRRSDYVVREIEQAECAGFIRENHYAGGCSHTSTFRFGLFRRDGDTLLGVAMWLPPTRRAAEAVDKARWKQVLSLTRMAVAPGVPKNACSFLLSRSIRTMKADGRFVSFVTYADTGEGHEGHVYIASGWQPFGESKATPRWRDSEGRLVAQLSTRTRKIADMEALGYRRDGQSVKKRFVLYPNDDIMSKLLRLGAAVHSLTVALR